MAADNRVAVIGIGVRFPGAPSRTALIDLLGGTAHAVKAIPPDRFDVDAFYDPKPGAAGKMYVRAAGLLDNVTDFDFGFFGISRAEAATMDPQQRLLLEVTWAALEDASLPPEALRARTVGSWVGISNGDYARIAPTPFHKIDQQWGTGLAYSIAANRLAYFFEWHGPSEAIDTACSSSLVAIHRACQSLHTEECDVAIAADSFGSVWIVYGDSNATWLERRVCR